jgi:transposase InsO family protein
MDNLSLDPANIGRQSPAPPLSDDTVRQLLNNLNARLETLELVPAATAAAPQSFGPTPKVALPDKFDGSISKCRRFISSVENVFAIQPSRYSTPEIRTRFIGTLLSGDALTWFSGIVEYSPELLLNYENFILELKNLFDDPHAQRHACTSLKRLRQGKFSVTSYSAKFRHLALETGYNDLAKMDIFRSGLNDDVKDVLATSLVDPETLEDLIKLCVKIDQRLYDRRLERNSNKMPYGHPDKPKKPSPQGNQSGSTPMDLDYMDGQKTKPHGKLTKEERARRIQNSLCLYCGEPGHKVNSCSKRSERSLNTMELFSTLAPNESSLSLKVNLENRRIKKSLDALLDSGANANFISQAAFEGWEMHWMKLDTPIAVRLADGSSKTVDYQVKNVKFKIEESSSGPLTFKADLLVIKDLRVDIVLGTPWFTSVNPKIDWKKRTIKFDRCSWSSSISLNYISLGDLKEKECSSNSPQDTLKNSVNVKRTRKTVTWDDGQNEMKRDFIGCTPGDFDEKECSSDFLDTHLTFRETRMEEKDGLEHKKSMEIFEHYYSDFSSLFEEKELNSLPPNRVCDMEINLVDESRTPPFLKIFRLTLKEEDLLKAWIDLNLKKGFIRPSKSPCAAPIFFVPKKDGNLRPCINYKRLNENTLPDGRPLPLISDILSQFHGAELFSTLDLKGAYNLVRMKPGHEWKAAFRSKFGLFEPLVVQFGLQNAPSVFQDFINSIFVDMLGKSLVIYIDDILIYSKSLEKHVIIVREVLKRLQDHHLVLKKKKCLFHVTEFVFLGHRISKNGISMDPEKVDVIAKFGRPTTVKELRSFLGMSNYYRKFVPRYSEVSKPLTDLTKKKNEFLWTKSAEEAFEMVKTLIGSDLMLRHPVLDKPFVIQTDASDFAVAGVLLQLDLNDNLCPLEFYSRKLNDSELNYSIHDKELLAIKESLQEWRHYLMHVNEPIQVFCDHKNLLYFKENRLTKPRHARWHEILMQFNFVLLQIKGEENFLADALSRDPALKGGKVAVGIQVLPERVFVSGLECSPMDQGQIDHDFPEDIGRYLASEDNLWTCEFHPFSQYGQYVKSFKLINDRLFYVKNQENRLYAPQAQRSSILKKFHDGLGHMGMSSILVLITRRYYWPNLESDVSQYCRNCQICQLSRQGRVSKTTYVTPVPPVAIPFERWGLDFVGRLVESKRKNNYIITAIDYASRWLVAKAVKQADESSVIDFLFREILVNYGVPNEIITDRGKCFLGSAVQEFIRKYQICHLKTSPYHPQTNGMVERVHSILNHSIRTLSLEADRWDEALDQAVLGIRIRKHAVTKISPFELIYGQAARLPLDLEFPTKIRVPLDKNERQEALLDYNSYKLKQLGQDRAAAYFKSVAQAKNMERTREISYKFDIGHYVKMRRHQRSKFEPYWTGPYVITEFGFPGTYWLIKANGQRLDSLVNEAQLAPWISQDDLEEINFNESNQLDNDVEEILEEVDIPPEGDNDDSR